MGMQKEIIIHDIESAAEKFNVSKYMIRQLVNSGLLPVLKRPYKNCKYYFREDDLLSLFQAE